MAVIERLDLGQGYKPVERELGRILDAGDEPAADGLVTAIEVRAEELIAAGDLRALLRYASRVDRLSHNLGGERHPEARGAVRGALRALLRRIDHAATASEQRRDVQRRDLEAAGVRARVLAAVSVRPHRSGDIARQLGVSPSQVSRALRELRQDGAVTLVDPPAGADRRARFYGASASLLAPHPRAA